MRKQRGITTPCDSELVRYLVKHHNMDNVLWPHRNRWYVKGFHGWEKCPTYDKFDILEAFGDLLPEDPWWDRQRYRLKLRYAQYQILARYANIASFGSEKLEPTDSFTEYLSRLLDSSDPAQLLTNSN